MGRPTKSEAVALSITVAEIARVLAAAELVSPSPLTQGDVDRFWETRAVADRRYYERRARQVFRVLTLPPGKPGHYMPRERGRRTNDG